MDALMRKVTDASTGGEEKVFDLDFADDVALLSNSWMAMAALLMKMEEVTQRFGNIRAKNREILHIGRSASDVRVEDVQLKGLAIKQWRSLSTWEAQ